MNHRLFILLATASFFCTFGAFTHAQGNLPKDVVAVVNGKQITAGLLEQNIKVNTAQGLIDSPELRKALIDELINRELLAQAAQKKSLHTNSEIQLQLEQLQKNLLADIAINDFLKNKNITDDQLKAEYQSQVQALGDTSVLYQYKIRQILVSKESDARIVLNRLKKESFEKIAQELSIDVSRDKGGDLGWVLPNQIIPAISNVMVNLSKGSISQAPIQTNNGWHIIRNDDKRVFKLPSFEESKDKLRQSLLQKLRMEYIAQLKKESKIQQ